MIEKGKNMGRERGLKQTEKRGKLERKRESPIEYEEKEEGRRKESQREAQIKRRRKRK